MKKCRINFCSALRHEGEQIVQNGLAMTPSDVLRSAEAGIPVSAQMNASFFDDGHFGSDWNLDLNDRRGVDIGHLWQEQMSSRQKMRNAHAQGEAVESNPN